MSSADVETLLTLQRMESKLVDALFEHPGAISRRREHELRYALSFAGLHRFQPGAAAKGGLSGRRDVPVVIPALALLSWNSAGRGGKGSNLFSGSPRARAGGATNRLNPAAIAGNLKAPEGGQRG